MTYPADGLDMDVGVEITALNVVDGGSGRNISSDITSNVGKVKLREGESPSDTQEGRVKSTFCYTSVNILF